MIKGVAILFLFTLAVIFFAKAFEIESPKKQIKKTVAKQIQKKAAKKGAEEDADEGTDEGGVDE